MTARDRTPPATDEVEEYRDEKQAERQRQAAPAAAERDPDWQSKDHLDPERAGDKPGRRRDAPADAEGQAEAGVIDQKVTSKGFTTTR
jgi:hypothetical protein